MTESTQSPRPLIESLELLDERLQHSHRPTHLLSPFWRQTLSEFYQSSCRQLVLRVGRRGGKSSSLCRVAIAEGLYGDHTIPLGDKGVFAFISTTLKEAKERLDTCEELLRTLDVRHKRTAGEIVLEDRPVVWRTYAASIAGVSGFTCIGAVCDEVAKWRDADTGANPATEVLASLRPTMATMPNARLFLSSSPMGTLDAHAAAFDAGDTAHQRVAFAPTWVAHPAITEELTHLLEPNEDVWRREYGAIPFEGSEAGLYAPRLVDAATCGWSEVEPERYHHYAAWMDAGMRGNAWTFGVATNRADKRAVVLLREWRGSTHSPLDPFRVFEEMAPILRRYEVPCVAADAYQFDALSRIAIRCGVTMHLDTLTAERKRRRYENLQARLADHAVELPTHRQMRADLLSVRRRATPNGISIELEQTPDGRHADFAPVVAGLLDIDLFPAPERMYGPRSPADEERELMERATRSDDDDPEFEP